MKEHHLQTIRTARFFTIGELSDSTKHIWIALHGYAQLAKDFIHPFRVLDDGEHVIIAPEGFNRFYAKGFGGQPAANWMTSEDRLNEISDYIYYLDQLYLSLALHQYPGAKITLLGFSQGVATASRWLCSTSHRIDHFIIYAGELASELQAPVPEKLSGLPIIYVTGKKDKLISSEKQETVYTLMKKLEATIIQFDGGHEVLPEVLEKISAALISAGNKN